MRRVSLKRQQLNRAVDPYRQQLRAQGFCDWCSGERNGLDIHEVCGGVTRAQELNKPFSTCLLCRPCHRDLEAMKKEHAVCIGLALIRYRRPESYSLSNFYRLTARNWPSELLVEHWFQRMLLGSTR